MQRSFPLLINPFTRKNSLLASLHQQAVLSFSWQLAVDFTESILKTTAGPLPLNSHTTRGNSVSSPPRSEKPVSSFDKSPLAGRPKCRRHRHLQCWQDHAGNRELWDSRFHRNRVNRDPHHLYPRHRFDRHRREFDATPPATFFQGSANDLGIRLRAWCLIFH